MAIVNDRKLRFYEEEKGKEKIICKMNMIIRRINQFTRNGKFNCQFNTFPGRTDKIEVIR